MGKSKAAVLAKIQDDLLALKAKAAAKLAPDFDGILNALDAFDKDFEREKKKVVEEKGKKEKAEKDLTDAKKEIETLKTTAPKESRKFGVKFARIK